MSIVEPIKDLNDVRRLKHYFARNNLRDFVLFTLGINCGLRISDIVALNVEDVKNKNYICVVEKKTGKIKAFPIHPKLKPMLEKFTKGRHPKEPLFITAFGNRLDRFGAYYILQAAGRAIHLHENMGTHTMRKTFGYHHYQKFKDVAMLQKIFNHSSPQITLRYIGIEQDEIDNSYNNFLL